MTDRQCPNAQFTMARNDSCDGGFRFLSLHYDVTSTLTDGLKTIRIQN